MMGNYLFFLIIVLINGFLYNLINNKEKIPIYMDEEFHLNQTLNYYFDNYNYWNSKLTTFPGTFFSAAAFLKFVYFFKKKYEEYDYIKYSRLFNILISSLSILLLGLYKSNSKKFLISISLLPINFFYNFLFYTDSFSSLSLIYFFYVILNKSNNLLVLCTIFITILARQNNIIWVNLIPLSELIDNLLDKNIDLKKIIALPFQLINKYYPIVIADILFICFLILNNFSVVLGDKSHHSLCCHLAHINHFLFFTLLFYPSLNLKLFKFHKIIKSGKQLFKVLFSFIILCIILFIFNKFSITHDFLLSDNRHFTFYYFRKIYFNLKLRYALIIYTSLIYSIFITENIEFLLNGKIIAYLICLFMTLVPTPLVEMRYYIPCFIIFLIIINSQINLMNDKEKIENFSNSFLNWLNILEYIFINCGIIFIFIYKPFKNEYFNGEQSRFMF